MELWAEGYKIRCVTMSSLTVIKSLSVVRRKTAHSVKDFKQLFYFLILFRSIKTLKESHFSTRIQFFTLQQY